jgi:hypothetical protein
MTELSIGPTARPIRPGSATISGIVAHGRAAAHSSKRHPGVGRVPARDSARHPALPRRAFTCGFVDFLLGRTPHNP